MSQPLLSVKTYLPQPQVHWIERPALNQKLAAALDHRLTLVSAPAGFGKTCTLCAWIARERERNPSTAWAWVSLDEGDNDPIRFWAYFWEALQKATAPGGENSSLRLQTQLGDRENLEETLGALLNDLATLPVQVVLVLDDYHLVSQAEIHALLGTFIERLPGNLHLVLATRSDPPFPLARLRSRGHLLEIRAAALRFNREETDLFLRQAAGVPLSPAQVHALDQRAEGWPASLQMAALALKGMLEQRSGETGEAALVEDFVRSFSGQHAYILDYFLEEVLQHQPPDLQDFLLRSSVLEKLSPELCSRLPGSERWTQSGGTFLERARRSNLFLVALNVNQTWFRYHHLFAELLRARLRAADPELEHQLHLAAAAWFEDQGMIEEALYHARHARDWERAARLVEMHWRLPVESGQYETAAGWFQTIPAELMRTRPRLALSYCWVLWLRGQIRQLQEWLRTAEMALQSPNRQNQPPAVFELAQADLFQAIVLRYQGDLAASVQSAERAAARGENLPKAQNDPESSWTVLFQGAAAFHLGESLRLTGAVRRAMLAYRKTIDLLALLSPVAVCGSYYNLCALHLLLGDGLAAYQTAIEGIEYTRRFAVQGLPAFAMCYTAAAEAAWELGRDQEAAQFLQQATELGHGSLNAARVGAYLRVRQCCPRVDPRRVDELLAPLAAGLEREDAGYLKLEMEAVRAQAYVRAGRLREVEAWVQAAGLSEENGENFPRRRIEITTLARLRRAQGKPQAARSLLNLALKQAQDHGYQGAAVELLLLRATTPAAGDSHRPGDDLAQALELGAAGGLLRVFLDEGSVLREALGNLAASPALRRLSEPGRRWLDRVLGAFAQLDPAKTPDPAEALTEREIEVLRLLAAGFTNRQIGEKLYLTEGTVKTHVHNLLGKLGVERRSQAAARAREQGLL